jgi:hypothetical protein
MIFDQSLGSYSYGEPVIFFGQEQTKRRRRRKRGGVKRNKNKRKWAARLLAKGEESDVEAEEDADTEAPSEEDEDAPLEADSSSCNGAENEGAEIFRAEDFPRLGKLVRN